MPRKSKSFAPSVSPRLRVMVGDEIAFGPGKAELLALIAETGSIREAAQQMDMSYMRAWTLVKTMNGCFNTPLIEAARGGQDHGGARLTKTGRRVLALYQKMSQASLKATAVSWKQLRQFLRD